ncbi:RagB/SusD family nutrient uptake outer membrane protein [Labilibaculum euxinus]
MKLKSKIIYLTVAIAGLLASCSDTFLDRPPLSNISSGNFYQTSEDLRLATAALYAGAQWGSLSYFSFLQIGEVMSGNMILGYNDDAVQINNFAVTGLNSAVITYWRSMYAVIQHCNITINAITEKAPNTISAEEINGAIAEAKFIRGYAYLNLAVLWGDVPIIEDLNDLINDPLKERNIADDVYQFVVNDLTYAAKYLPVSDEKGRVTTWSAQGLLAKTYLTWSGLNSTSGGQRNEALLDSAKLYAGNVCHDSGLELMDSYEDVFKYEFTDDEEILFSLQWSPVDQGWLNGNMLQLFSSAGFSINGVTPWFGIRPTYDMYLQYSEADSVRRKATFMYKGDHYAELNQEKGGVDYTGDAGLKKHIVGNEKDVNAPTMGVFSSAEHTPLLRLSDVYLVYAEAILGNNGSTSDAEALLYFNKVHKRAGLEAVTEINDDAMLRERRIELAAESQYWMDLVRLSYYNPTKAIGLLNGGERVIFTLNDAGVAEPQDAYGIITPANINTFKLPIPSDEITADPKLLDEPVPYF